MSSFRENLSALGLCESTLADLRRELERMPLAIGAAEAGAQAAREAVNAERARLADAEKARREKEAELADTEAKRAKFQGQSALVKTNHEYTALLGEIEETTRRISRIEDEILLAMEGADAAREQLADVEKEQKEHEQGMLREAARLRERMTLVQQQLETQGKLRDGLLAELGPEVQKHYDRIAARGTAVARIISSTCGECHRSVPPETANRVLAGDLHTCAYCQRILVFPAD